MTLGWSLWYRGTTGADCRVSSAMFGNESRFCLRRLSHRVKVWSSSGERLADCSTARATHWWRPRKGVGQHLLRCWSISREIPLRSWDWTLPSKMTTLCSTEEERREMPASFPDHNLVQHRRLHPRPALDGRMTDKTTSVGVWHKLIGEWISIIIIIIVWRDQHEKEEPSCHEWSYWATELLRVLFAKNRPSIFYKRCLLHSPLGAFPSCHWANTQEDKQVFHTHARTDNLESTNMQNMPRRKASCSASNRRPSCREATVLTHCATVSPVCQCVLGQTFNPPNSDAVIQWY